MLRDNYSSRLLEFCTVLIKFCFAFPSTEHFFFPMDMWHPLEATIDIMSGEIRTLDPTKTTSGSNSLDSPLLLNLNLQQSLEGLSRPGRNTQGHGLGGADCASLASLQIKHLHQMIACLFYFFFRNNLGMILYWWSSKLSSPVKCLSALTISKPKRKKVIWKRSKSQTHY